MIMKYITELEYIKGKIKEAYNLFAVLPPGNIVQKTTFDLVTNIDVDIENYLIESIKTKFPKDNILSEELHSQNQLFNRTWTIDPIDGTCNMARRMPLYGIQCALIENGEIVLSIIYLPIFDEMFSAIANGGAMLNGCLISVNGNIPINNAIVSFGDYSHANPENAKREHKSINHLYPKIAKVRFFGAACIDFSYTALGRIDGTVMITKNLWDIAPGILLCKEAGALVTNLEGTPYKLGDNGVVVTSNEQMHLLIIESLALK